MARKSRAEEMMELRAQALNEAAPLLDRVDAAVEALERTTRRLTRAFGLEDRDRGRAADHGQRLERERKREWESQDDDPDSGER